MVESQETVKNVSGSYFIEKSKEGNYILQNKANFFFPFDIIFMTIYHNYHYRNAKNNESKLKYLNNGVCLCVCELHLSLKSLIWIK